MANETRELLKGISQILHKAGWDNPEKPEHAVGPNDTSRLTDDLSSAERAAFYLIGAANMEISEVAHEANLPEERVREIYESARKKIKEQALESLRKSMPDRFGS